MPEVSTNGFKIVQDGVESYDVVEKEKDIYTLFCGAGVKGQSISSIVNGLKK